MTQEEDVRLEEILGDPGKSIVFLRFCETVHCEENALFYLAVERMRKSVDRSAEQLQAATDIYEKYVATGAPFCIQTPSHVKEICKAALTPTNFNPNIFDHAQRLVLSLLASEYLALFIASQSYLNLELEGILLHPERGDIFMKFLRGRYSEENMLFYGDVTRWSRRLRLIAEEAQEKKVPINQIRQEVLIDARSIFNQYLKHHAEFKIDVSDEARTRVVHEINAATRGARINPSVFQECLERVMRIMRVELLPDFLSNEREEQEKEKQLDHERQSMQAKLAEQQALRRPVSAFSNKPIVISGKGADDDEDFEPIPIGTPTAKLPKFLLNAAQNDFIDMTVVRLFNKIVVKQENVLQKKKKTPPHNNKPTTAATPNTRPTHASSNSMSVPLDPKGEPHSPLPPMTLIKKAYSTKRRHSVDAADLRIMADVHNIYRIRTEKKQRKQKAKEKLTKRLAKSGIDLAQQQQQSNRSRAVSEAQAQARAQHLTSVQEGVESHSSSSLHTVAEGSSDSDANPSASNSDGQGQGHTGGGGTAVGGNGPKGRAAATVTITAPSPHATQHQPSLGDLFQPLSLGPSASTSASASGSSSSSATPPSPPTKPLSLVAPVNGRSASPAAVHAPSASTDGLPKLPSTPGAGGNGGLPTKKSKRGHHPRRGKDGPHSEDWNNESQDSSSSDEGETAEGKGGVITGTPPDTKILGDLNIDDDSPHINRNYSVDAYSRPDSTGRALGPNPLGHGSVDFSGSYAQHVQKKKALNMETDPVTGKRNTERNAEREKRLAEEEEKEKRQAEPQHAEMVSANIAKRLRKNARNFQLHSRAAALKAADPAFALLCNARSDPLFYGAGLRPAYGHGRGSQTADDNVLTLYRRRMRKLVKSKLHILAGPKIAVLPARNVLPEEVKETQPNRNRLTQLGMNMNYARSSSANSSTPNNTTPMTAQAAAAGGSGAGTSLRDSLAARPPNIEKKASSQPPSSLKGSTLGRPIQPVKQQNNVRFMLSRLVIIPDFVDARNTLVPPSGSSSGSTAPNTPASGSTSPSHTHSHTPSSNQSFNFSTNERNSTSAPGHPREVRPILKPRKETFDELQARMIKEQEKEQSRLLDLMVAGTPLVKYNAMGKGARRFFFVSDDGTELCWTASGKRAPTVRSGIFSRVKRKVLADVTRMRYGSRFSRRFYQYNNLNRPPWLSFTVCFPDRTVDIVCKDEEEVSTWYLGLQSLAPLSPGYCSRAGLLWRRARLKIKYNAKKQMMNERQFLNRLIDDAKEAVRNQRIQAAENAAQSLKERERERLDGVNGTNGASASASADERKNNARSPPRLQIPPGGSSSGMSKS